MVARQNREAFDRLDRGDIDLVFSTFTKMPKADQARNDFLPMPMSALSDVITRAGPATSNPRSRKRYVTTPHILATLAADDRGIVDEALAKLGHRRRVAVTVPNVYLIPRLVAETGMISHLPRRIAAEMLQGYDVVMFAPPVTLPEWHIDNTGGLRLRQSP